MARRTEQNASLRRIALASLLLFGLCLWTMWPGVAAYDTLRQYEQALAGQYDDWHPPVMARLWALTLAVGGRGMLPMLLLQLAGYWAGIGLFAGGLARSGAPRAAFASLLVALSPILLNWLPVVVKDTQMIAALVAATGIVAWYRLPGGRLPWAAVALVALLLGYAALVRANAVFAVVPFALMLAGWGGVRRWWARAMVMGAATILVILVSDPINHRLFAAERSGVTATLPVFDMVGIAHFAPLAAPPGLTPAEWAQAEARHCYTPFYWDPFADRTRCGTMGDAIAAEDDTHPSVIHRWVATIAAHPIAYAEHRLAHLNATLRIATPAAELSSVAPSKSDANPDGLGGPQTRGLLDLKTLAAALERTPLGVPAVWALLLAGIFWTLLATPRQPARELGLALAFSGLMMTASFAVVSIASDLRYHLWLIVAANLAAVLLAACRGVDRGRLGWALGVTVAAIAISVVLRATAGPLAI
ncbi:hypothetical protein [uncultured Sphingomonas sp.]|uniref:hypothetical protein n=1 Tax=uncultured Sphingomonas sp. TaxID=158754 RepID=UPI00261F4BB8|nr:hypothetical protein [uncultured Sphingomonas sp.]